MAPTTVTIQANVGTSSLNSTKKEKKKRKKAG
jgi:hypothetical protein